MFCKKNFQRVSPNFDFLRLSGCTASIFDFKKKINKWEKGFCLFSVRISFVSLKMHYLRVKDRVRIWAKQGGVIAIGWGKQRRSNLSPRIVLFFMKSSDLFNKFSE